MAELKLRVRGSYGESDLAIRFDSHTTIGALADGLESNFDRPGDVPRTVHRQTRGAEVFPRDTPIQQSDLRNGDIVSLALDNGLRASSASGTIATIRVVAGPDSGRIFDLQRGESTVGRASSCDITINDEAASRRHAIVRVSDIVEVADAGSTNGVQVNDQLLVGSQRLRPGDRVHVGDSVLTVELLGGGHEAAHVVDNAVEFNRPPRIEKAFVPEKIVLPMPPDPLGKQRFPLIAAIIPLLMGGAMFAMTGSARSVMFIALSPLMLFGNYFEGKRTGRKDHASKVAEHAANLADQIERLDQARDQEIASKFRFSPATTELLSHVDDLSPRLWERMPGDADFLHLRLGLIEQESTVTVELGSGGKRDQRKELEDLAATYQTLPPVPLTFDARLAAPVGVAGPDETRRSLARSLILQAATLHSPHELAIGGLFGDESAQAWDWIKWLPHSGSANNPLPRSLISVGAADGIEFLAAIQDLISERLDDEANFYGDSQQIFVPHLILLIDDSVSIERARFARLLKQGATAGISIFWLAGDARRIPNASKTLISIEPGQTTATLADSTSGISTGSVPLETIQAEAAIVVARSLAPVVDMSAPSTSSTSLPDTVSLIELLGGLEIVESTDPVVDRWRESKQERKLRAPVGEGEGGPLTIDLRVDGPHGLVGGTTGAGKSEFLQALLASLATLHSPDRINFLLVDYKGGSAFGDLVDQHSDDGRLEWKGLTHTVGMITDLTPALVQRALVSLQAELHRREVILNNHRVKDLMEMEKRNIPGTPASLLIVVDEFAALAKEVPAFVDGVVDIAQRGRSLGMHLLLATQKPGGVVTPNIQANTNLRVALRMATEDESADVVRSPIAGRIDRSTPGRGVMRRGPSDLVAFQSAYVGGTTTRATQATLQIGEFTSAGVQWIPSKQESSWHKPEQETDLRMLVKTINGAAQRNGLKAPRRPWLDPLPPLVDLLALPRQASDERLTIGLADLPHRQSREVATFSPDDDGSMLLYGMGGAGKTVALRTIAASAGLTKDKSPSQVFGLDFASRGLDLLSPLPHVGDIVPGDDYERVTRLLKDLRTEKDRRIELFAGARASSLSEYRASSRGDASLPRMYVLVDGYDNFLASFEKVDRGEWAELLPRLVADGRQLGIHFAMTGTRRSSFPMALASQVPFRLVFKLASDDDYHSVNVDPKFFDSNTPAGRCRVGEKEVQIAILGTSPSTSIEAEEFRRLGKGLEGRVTTAKRVQVLPENVSLAELPPAMTGARWLLTEDFRSLGPDFSQNILIAGRPRSGKTLALTSLRIAAAEIGIRGDLFVQDPARCEQGGLGFDALAERLTSDPTGVVFIESVERVAGSPAEFPLQQALGTGKLIVVGTADNTAARAYDQTIRAMRARCDVVVLQPDIDVDGELLGGPLPRTARRFPPGRGYVSLLGRMFVAHVATP